MSCGGPQVSQGLILRDPHVNLLGFDSFEMLVSGFACVLQFANVVAVVKVYVFHLIPHLSRQHQLLHPVIVLRGFIRFDAR